jgi:hypothetical protein
MQIGYYRLLALGPVALFKTSTGHLERKIMNQYEKDILWASSQFLYDDLPNNWKDWSQKELYSFVEQHAWEPFQYWSGSKLWTHIIDLAESMRKYAQEN